LRGAGVAHGSAFVGVEATGVGAVGETVAVVVHAVAAVSRDGVLA
jgi:hypothetical protein